MVAVRHHDVEHPEPGADVSGRRDRRPRRLCAGRGRHACCSRRCGPRSTRSSMCSARISSRRSREGRYRRPQRDALFGLRRHRALAASRSAAASGSSGRSSTRTFSPASSTDASMPLIVALSGMSAATYLTYNVPLALIQAAGHFKPVALATTFGGLVGLVRGVDPADRHLGRVVARRCRRRRSGVRHLSLDRRAAHTAPAHGARRGVRPVAAWRGCGHDRRASVSDPPPGSASRRSACCRWSRRRCAR